MFCADKTPIDYKNVSLLQRFVSDRGKIVPRRRTGVCAKHQRSLAQAIKRSRYLAMLPSSPNHVYNMSGSRKKSVIKSGELNCPRGLISRKKEEESGSTVFVPGCPPRADAHVLKARRARGRWKLTQV